MSTQPENRTVYETNKSLTTIKTRVVGGKEYIIRSVFIGTQDIQTAIQKLAEKKTVRDMGL
jgi:hypothetical protein